MTSNGAIDDLVHPLHVGDGEGGIEAIHFIAEAVDDDRAIDEAVDGLASRGERGTGHRMVMLDHGRLTFHDFAGNRTRKRSET